MAPGHSKPIASRTAALLRNGVRFFFRLWVIHTAVRFSSMKAWGGQLRCSLADHDSKASMVLRKSFSECARETMSASNGAGGK